MVHENVNAAFCSFEIQGNGTYLFHARKGDVVLASGDTVDGGRWSASVLTDMPLDLIFLNRPNFYNWNLTGNNTGKAANAKWDDCYHYYLEQNDGVNSRNLPVEPENCRHAHPEEITIDGVVRTVYTGQYENIKL